MAAGRGGGAVRRALVTFGCGDCGRLGHGGAGGGDASSWVGEELPRLVAALLDLQPKVVACGGAHTAIVADDGSVLTFGLNDRGQLGHSADAPEGGTPQEAPLPEPAAAVAAGYYHTLALTESGAVWAWGDNARGQLGAGQDLQRSPLPRLVKGLQGTRIVALAAGSDFSLALSAGGEVYSWGAAGRLGHGKPASLQLWGSRDEFKPRVVRPLEAVNVKQIAAGQLHAGAVSADGQTYLWGGNRFYQLGLGHERDEHAPHLVGGAHGVSSLACGGLHTLAAQHGGDVLAWGANQNGCLGLGHQQQQQARRPARVPKLAAEHVAAGWKHSAAVTADGRLLTWGFGGSQGSAYSFQGGSGGGGGQLGHGNDFDYWSPTAVEWLQLSETEMVRQEPEGGGALAWRVLQVACGLNHTAAVVELPGVTL